MRECVNCSILWGLEHMAEMQVLRRTAMLRRLPLAFERCLFSRVTCQLLTVLINGVGRKCIAHSGPRISTSIGERHNCSSSQVTQVPPLDESRTRRSIDDTIMC